MSNPFTYHPNQVGLGYFGHMFFALKVFGQLFLTSFACLIHAFFPFLFTHTTSKVVKKLHGLIEHRINQ